jgi:hypothetical protein
VLNLIKELQQFGEKLEKMGDEWNYKVINYKKKIAKSFGTIFL